MRKLFFGLVVALVGVLIFTTPVLAQTGPTQAPDLISVDNFREEADANDTGGGDTDTYVDFTFDQPADIVSCCAGFQLVPVDGGNPFTALSPEISGDGTTTITLAFEEAITAAEIARGTVDQNVVKAQGGTDETNNPPQAADVSNDGNTDTPDLVSVEKDGDQLLFTFDEALDQEDVIQNTSGLRFYTQSADTYNSSNVRETSDPAVLRAIYDLPQNVTLDDAVGGYVPANTVTDADGPDGNVNQLDEVSPVGDTGVQVCPAPGTAGTPGDGSGVTEAPDLTSVGNFRRGPFTDEYNPTTCVDFTFDQEAYLNGGTRANFQLVPLNGGDALDGSTNINPGSDQTGDVVVTVVFPGDIEPGNFARGYVDTGVVNSREQGANPDNPFNVNQSESVTPNTTTENPDLVSATFDGGDQIIYEFDEALTTDDVIQNTSGLRVYFPQTDTDTIRDAGAATVNRESPTTLRAFFADDLPGGKTLEDAIGGFVQQGTVQAAQGSRGGNDGKNAFDELAPLDDSGRTVCDAPTNPAPGAGNGPTEAPDLNSVGNFRRGPATAQGTPTTCVDFSFDQTVYLKGGNRTSFHLVPKNGGDALDGADIVPESDQEGDNIVTVAFPGSLSPDDFPRGYVDSKVATSREQGANPENPFNVNQSEPISNNGTTANPDLVSVRLDGDQVLYKFDEALTTDDVIQSTSGLRLYFPETDTSAIRDAGAQSVKRKNDTTLRAYFGKDLPGGKTLEDAIGGFVVQGTVQAVQGSRGSNDGKNAFDELAPIGDTGAEVCPAPSGVGGTGAGNGPTEAPDLLSVGNFRRGPSTSQFTPTTCVDFIFDQKAYLNGGDKSNFQLVPLNAGDAISGSTNVRTESDQKGDNIVTVVFPGNLKPANFARGYVDTGVVSSREQGANSQNPYNINQSEDINPRTSTANPDLVSVKRAGKSFLFKFDEPLDKADVAENSSGLRLYFPKAKQGSTIPFAGSSRIEEVKGTRRTLRAFYKGTVPANYSLSQAVGAYVVQGSVQAAQGSRGGNSGKNAFDELSTIGVAGPGPKPDPKPDPKPEPNIIRGTNGSDNLRGTPGRDIIYGLGGSDTIRGLGGNDVIRGGGGDDIIYGGPGNDRLLGGAGRDLLFGEGGRDTLLGGPGDDVLRGGPGKDTEKGGPGRDITGSPNAAQRLIQQISRRTPQP